MLGANSLARGATNGPVDGSGAETGQSGGVYAALRGSVEALQDERGENAGTEAERERGRGAAALPVQEGAGSGVDAERVEGFREQEGLRGVCTEVVSATQRGETKKAQRRGEGAAATSLPQAPYLQATEGEGLRGIHDPGEQQHLFRR